MRDLQGGVITQHPGEGFAYGVLLLGKTEIHAGVAPHRFAHRTPAGLKVECRSDLTNH